MLLLSLKLTASSECQNQRVMSGASKTPGQSPKVSGRDN